MGDSGPPPLNKWPFFAQKWPKNAIFEPKTAILALGWSVSPHSGLICRCLTQNNCGATDRLGKWVIQGQPPPPRNGHFLPKNGLKMPFLGQKQYFLGSAGHFNTPPPYFAGAQLDKTE